MVMFRFLPKTADLTGLSILTFSAASNPSHADHLLQLISDIFTRGKTTNSTETVTLDLHMLVLSGDFRNVLSQ